LQDISTVSEQNALNDQDRSELTVNSGRNSSQRFSVLRSISQESSGSGNSSRHSFSIPFGVPTKISVLENETAETNAPASAPTQPPPEVSLRRLAYLNKPEVPVLLLGTLAAAANGVLLPVFGILISSIIKTFYEPRDKLQKDSKFWALIFVVLGVASLLAQPSRSYLFAVAGCKLIRRIRSMCFEKVVYMEVSWFDEAEHSSGALGARLSTDATSVRGLVGDSLSLLVQNIATAIGGLVIAFTANWQLALIILVLLPLIGVNGYVQIKFMRGFSADAKVFSKSYKS
jgi:ATP-binding cassette subfamily B (MDR/TAP) protein 1